jgi:Phage integrase family
VFTSTIGTPMMGADVTKRCQARLAAAGLPRMRFHDLRHGADSLLFAKGVHPRVVMEMLGHSTIALTMNVYSHVIIPELQREAADKWRQSSEPEPVAVSRAVKGPETNARSEPSQGRRAGVFVLRSSLVPGVGLEPTRACAHRCLRPTRLPVPPPRRGQPSL